MGNLCAFLSILDNFVTSVKTQKPPWAPSAPPLTCPSCLRFFMYWVMHMLPADFLLSDTGVPWLGPEAGMLPLSSLVAEGTMVT